MYIYVQIIQGKHDDILLAQGGSFSGLETCEGNGNAKDIIKTVEIGEAVEKHVHGVHRRRSHQMHSTIGGAKFLVIKINKEKGMTGKRKGGKRSEGNN